MKKRRVSFLLSVLLFIPSISYSYVTPYTKAAQSVYPDLNLKGIVKTQLAISKSKVGSNVIRLQNAIRPAQLMLLGIGSPVQLSNNYQKVDEKGKIQVYVKYSDNKSKVIEDIISVGGKVDLVSEPMSLVQAWVPYDKIDELASPSYVKSITLPDYPKKNAGSVLTEGDAILGANSVRGLGYAGAGVKVGVISDGIKGISLSQSSGDIPSAYEAQSARSDNDLDAGAEGLAMMEIVHDLAPAASLAFSNPGTSAEMLRAIQILDSTYNCDIIVDDLGFFGQPWFEDGDIAQEAKSAVSRGKIYITAAGNSGSQEYFEASFAGVSKVIGGGTVTVNDYNGLGDAFMPLAVPGNSTAVVFLQWNDRFGSSSNDYDLYLTDSSGSTIYNVSQDTQNGAGDPIEATYVTNSGSSTGVCYIVIRKFSGATRRLKVVVNGGYLLNYYSAAGSIFGHQSCASLLSVGAIDHATPNNIEPYSSRGPVRIDFPSLEYRQKPDLCGIDGVSVTGNGGFPSEFFGTSAAAPHIAGLAAQIWATNKSMSNTQVINTLKNSSVDLGAFGFDNVFGFGRPNIYSVVTKTDTRYNNTSKGISIEFPRDLSPFIPIVVTAETVSNPSSLSPYPAATRLASDAINVTCNVASLITSPISITMNYNLGALNPMPYYWDTTSSKWSDSGLVVTSKTSSSITFTSTHLSTFAIFGVSGNINDILVYPNPCTSTSGVTFSGLKGDETIRIYTQNGEFVALSNTTGLPNWTWNATNQANATIARGIYLYLLTNTSGQKRIGKIAVLN